MKDIYNDGTYLKNNPNWHEDDALLKIEAILKLLKRHKLFLKTVAEIGCGSGEILVQLEKHLHDVEGFYGFDISEAAIEIAEKKSTDKIKFEKKDVLIESDTQYFDVVLVIDVIEHVENYFSFLERIAKKSKYTIFHVPLDMCVWTLFREKILIDSRNRVGHIHNFTEEFIKNIITERGFEILDSVYTKPVAKGMTGKHKFINFFRKMTFATNKKLSVKVFGGYSVMLLARNKENSLQENHC